MTTYRPYTTASAINKEIPSPAPVHPDSGKMISSANHWLLAGTAYDKEKEWLFPYWRNHYFRGDTSKLAKVKVYANANGWVGAGPFATPMPSWMASMPRFTSGDGNVVIVDSMTGDVWEMWHTTPPGTAPRDAGHPSDRWNCSEWRHWPTTTLTGKGYGSPSTSNQPGTSASKMQLACGLLVPEDFADCFSGSDPGSVIPHALRIDSFCNSNGSAFPKCVPPAYGGDGRQADGFPLGVRVQLDPSINVSTWPSVNAKREPWRSGLKKVLRTLQVYGGIPVDSTPAAGSGDLDCVSPESVAKGTYNGKTGWKFPWDAAGYGWGYGAGIPYDLMQHFRVVDWTKWTGA